MAGPLDAVMAIHNAFRHDMTLIDAAALDSARGKPGLAATVERFRFFNEVLVWHAHGEELAIFPALEGVAPVVAEAYEKDHRGLDAAFDALSDAVSARDALADRARHRGLQVPSRHSPGQGRRASVPPHQGAHLRARAGQGGRRHGEHRAAGPLPGGDRLDVPPDGQRRPREHDPHLADGDAARHSREPSSSSRRRSAMTGRSSTRRIPELAGAR